MYVEEPVLLGLSSAASNTHNDRSEDRVKVEHLSLDLVRTETRSEGVPSICVAVCAAGRMEPDGGGVCSPGRLSCGVSSGQR